jgi:hypothetical protein
MQTGMRYVMSVSRRVVRAPSVTSLNFAADINQRAAAGLPVPKDKGVALQSAISA